jgi:quinol monooxygenase YgiN
MSEITRIVRLTFVPEKVSDFLLIFERSKSLIRNFSGCKHLALKQDFHHPNVFYTYSVWEDHDALDRYRQSELFKSTWAKTKLLFDAKPSAFSLMEPN